MSSQFTIGCQVTVGACLSAVMSVSSQWEGGAADNLHMWPVPLPACSMGRSSPPHAGWGELSPCGGWGEGGRIGLRNVHIWAPPPFPQPNCPVKWAKSTAGEFRIHRKLLRVDFTSDAFANGPNWLGLGLTGHFEAPIWNIWKKGAAVCQGAYFTQLV